MVTGNQNLKIQKAEGAALQGQNFRQEPAPHLAIPVTRQGLTPPNRGARMKRIDKATGRFGKNRQVFQGDEGGVFRVAYHDGTWEVDYFPTPDARWDERKRLGWFTKNDAGNFEPYTGNGLTGEYRHREDAIQALYDNWLVKKEWLRGPEAEVAYRKVKNLKEEYETAEAVRKMALEKLRKYKRELPFELEDIEEDDK